MQTAKININDICEVTLTPEGTAHLKATDHSSYLYNFNKDTNVLKIELWEIMHIFGYKLYNGCQQLFEDNQVRLNHTSEGS